MFFYVHTKAFGVITVQYQGHYKLHGCFPVLSVASKAWGRLIFIIPLTLYLHLLHICDVCHAVAHAQSRRPTHYNWLLINIVKSVGAWELCCYFQELQFSYTNSYAWVQVTFIGPWRTASIYGQLGQWLQDDDFEGYIDEDELLEQTTHRRISVQQEVLLCTNTWLPRAAVTTGHEGSPMLIQCLSSTQTKMAYFCNFRAYCLR